MLKWWIVFLAVPAIAATDPGFYGWIDQTTSTQTLNLDITAIAKKGGCVPIGGLYEHRQMASGKNVLQELDELCIQKGGHHGKK